MLRAIETLTHADIIAKSRIAKWAVEILWIHEQLTLLSEPVNITGKAPQAIQELQKRVDEQARLENQRQILLSQILEEGASICALALVRHLTAKTERSQE